MLKNQKLKEKRILTRLLIGFILIVLILIFSEKEKNILPLNLKDLSQNTYSQTLFVHPLIKAKTEWPRFLLIENSYLKSNLPPFIIHPQVLAQIITGQELDNEIQTHIVKSGETLSLIAQKYNLKTETIIWANNLKNSLVSPGQELVILPVDGVVHLVKEGDTLEKIAKKYKADPEKILVFNELSTADEIFENQALIVPGGKLPSLPQKIASKGKVSPNFSTNNFYGLSASYPYGYCTWWVAQKRAIPALGHAKDWLDNAIIFGFPVCKGSNCTPQVGAVISVKGNPYYGHVGYVERIENDKVIFSEMNYIGWGKMNYRSLRIGDPRILGYIYKTF